MPAPDNIYENDVDFTTLALQYPEFAKRLKPNGQLDFSDPESVRQLTKSLLHRDFGLTIDLPEDRLCPPVPNRFNYILFIQRLLDDTCPDWHEGYDPTRQVIGLDIGTGSSAIYPLLACRQRPQWRFLATEIDEKNHTYALNNIATNGLQSRIKLLDTDPTGETLIPIREIERIGIERIDIVMTNPPFYPSASSLLESARQKSRPPNSSCTGAPVEMITPGGEVSFVSRLIIESSHPDTRQRIQWFSSMLGKLSSVSAVVDRLKVDGCTNFAVAEFVQGQKAKTRRWCVAWSWMGYRPGVRVSRGVSGSSGVEKRLLPAPSEYDFEIDTDLYTADNNLGGAEDKLNHEMARLDVLWKYLPQRHTGMFISRQGDVWSRKARRKKLQHGEQPRHSQGVNLPKQGGNRGGDQDGIMHDENTAADGSDSDGQGEGEGEDEPALVARISVTPVICTSSHQPQRELQSQSQSQSRQPVPDATTSNKTRTRFHLRHLQGQDHVLFESFCGWLKRRMSMPVLSAGSST